MSAGVIFVMPSVVMEPGGHVLPKAEVGEDTYFASGVYALYVGGWVGLGVALLLGLAQRLLEALAHLYHFGEDCSSLCR